MAEYRAGNYQAALAALRESMDAGKGGDGFDWFFVAMSHWRLGDAEEARKWHDKAVAWMGKRKPKDQELIAFAAEAAELLQSPPVTRPAASR